MIDADGLPRKSLFCSVFANVGPLLEEAEGTIEAAALDWLRDSFRFAISRNRRAFGRTGEIYFDILRNDGFNAFATKQDDVEMVALLSGLLNEVYNVCFIFLSDPKSLPHIGQPEHGDINSAAIDLLRRGMAIKNMSIVPKDEVRMSLARTLAFFTCLIVVFHEVGHIVQGHAEFLQEFLERPGYEEFPMVSASNDQPDLRLAMEYEADEYAAGSSFQLFRHFAQHPPFFDRLHGLDVDILWGICTTLFFALSSLKSGILMDDPVETHPRPFFRIMFAVAAIDNSKMCQAMEPRFDSFEKGMTEVLNWSARAGIPLLSRDADDTEQAFCEEVGRIKAALRAHKSELDVCKVRRSVSRNGPAGEKSAA